MHDRIERGVNFIAQVNAITCAHSNSFVWLICLFEASNINLGLTARLLSTAKRRSAQM